MRNGLIAILITVLSALTLSSQELEWSVDMNAVFKNTEVENSVIPGETFIFTRITPQIGVSLDSARHRIMGGVTWYQPLNDHLHGYKVLPALYYQYQNLERGIWFKFGFIPNELNNSCPTFLRSDSINITQPNIKGLVFTLDKPHFYLYSWLDWRQMQTLNHREAFDVTGHMAWYTNKDNNSFAASAVLRYNHLSVCKRRPEGEGVVDNVIFSPQLSYSHYWDKAMFSLSAGMLMSCDRDREGDNKWKTPVGFIAQMGGQWKWLKLTENLYVGDKQMPLYEKFGGLLYLGDPFYHNKFYSRTDLVATIFQRNFLNFEARLSFHAAEDKKTAFSQQLAVRFFLDKHLWRYHKNKPTGIAITPLPSHF
jgi:hypothetical protein